MPSSESEAALDFARSPTTMALEKEKTSSTYEHQQTYYVQAPLVSFDAHCHVLDTIHSYWRRLGRFLSHDDALLIINY